MLTELCRDVAFEAARRSDAVNPHELWAALEELAVLPVRTAVDLWGDDGMRWALWTAGARMVVVSPTTTPARAWGLPSIPSSVTEIVGDPKDRAIARRVGDQCAAFSLDLLVLGAPNSEVGMAMDWRTYAPLVRPGGIALVRGIGNPRFPGLRRWWLALDGEKEELIGETHPDGYGLVRMHGRDRLSHG